MQDVTPEANASASMFHMILHNAMCHIDSMRTQVGEPSPFLTKEQLVADGLVDQFGKPLTNPMVIPAFRGNVYNMKIHIFVLPEYRDAIFHFVNKNILENLNKAEYAGGWFDYREMGGFSHADLAFTVLDDNGSLVEILERAIADGIFQFWR